MKHKPIYAFYSDHYKMVMPESIALLEHPAEYDVDWFIKKFNLVPYENYAMWWIRKLDKNTNVLECCTLGLCGSVFVHETQSVRHSDESMALGRIFYDFCGFSLVHIAAINDGEDVALDPLFPDKKCVTDVFPNVFKLASPKDRMLHVLNIIKERAQ